MNVKFPQSPSFSQYSLVKTENIVTHTTITRQRLGKNIPEVKFSTIEGHPLLGNGPIYKRL
jgi:hypothetical protein